MTGAFLSQRPVVRSFKVFLCAPEQNSRTNNGVASDFMSIWRPKRNKGQLTNDIDETTYSIRSGKAHKMQF